MKLLFRWINKLLCGWNVGLYFRPRIRYEGKKCLPAFTRGPAILITNHKNQMDFLLVLYLFYFRYVRCLVGKTFYECNRFLNWCLRMLGAIKVDRFSFGMDFFCESVEALRRGQLLLIFPEGRFSTTGEILEFRSTAALLALQTDVPIIPMWHSVNYGFGKRTDVVIGEPIRLSELCSTANPDAAELDRLTAILRDKVIEKVHPNTRPVDQIFSELAEACGVGEYFGFSVEDLADAQLASVGLSLATLRQKGTSAFPEKTFEYGKTPEWKTPTGKIQFASDACEEAGLPRVPQWREPAVSVPDDGASFRLIGGKQAIHSHTQTANIEALMDITKQYGLDRVWMNAGRAAELGIADGDTVLVSNDLFSGQIKVKVTERINPEALYLPSHYGCSSPQQKTAYNVGLRQMDFVPYRLEEGYGGACTQETFVTVRKVGA